MVKAWAHQVAIMPVLKQKSHMLLWDAGTGKTLPLLQTAYNRGGRCLYLGPPAIRSQVRNEAVEYGLFYPHEMQIVLSGKDKIASQAKLVICSYDHLHDAKIWKQLFQLRWTTMILDEAHLLKNTSAKRTRAVYGARMDSPGALVRKADQVLISTGTPLVNDPSDLWPHVSRVFPDVLQKTRAFQKDSWINQFCYTEDTPWGRKILGGKNLDELRDILKPHISRVKKEDVLDLPPLHVTELWVPPEDISMEGIPQEAVDELEYLINKNDPDLWSKLERFETALATLRRRIGLAKAKHTAEIAASELNSGVNKVIIFYQHKDVAQELLDYLGPKFPTVQYSGGLPQHKRDAVVREFHGNARVLLAQIQAAGTGLNLQCADRVIILEPSWTPAANDQAISRAYRGGQTKKVWVSLVSLSQSIDESIQRALKRKSKIIQGVLA